MLSLASDNNNSIHDPRLGFTGIALSAGLETPPPSPPQFVTVCTYTRICERYAG